MTPAEIWKKLTPSQRVTLLKETHPQILYRDLHTYGDAALERAGLKRRGRMAAEQASGPARHALGRRGLLEIGQPTSMPTSAAGFHTPRRPTAIGRTVADHGVALLTEGASMSHAKKKKSPPSPVDARATVRRLMRSSGFDEEEVYGGAADQLHFASREDGDVLEGRADPGTVRFAREKAKEVEAAVPGAKARTEVVDEWVSIAVTLPPGTPPVPRSAPKEPPARAVPPPQPRQRASLRPGDEVKYTNFTIGGSYEGTAIVTWDHGKSVEARTIGGERLRLERAADGSLRRFT